MKYFHVSCKLQTSMKTKLYLAMLAVAAVSFVLLRPTLFVFVGAENIYCAPAADGTKIVVNFIHSVQKTPVEECLAVESSGFRLMYSRYQSFGVGLPFLASEGSFRQDGDFFVMDNMNRFYQNLEFRVGLGTKLTLSVGDVKLNLYERFPVGTKVDVVVAPFYEKYSRRLAAK